MLLRFTSSSPGRMGEEEVRARRQAATQEKPWREGSNENYRAIATFLNILPMSVYDPPSWIQKLSYKQ